MNDWFAAYERWLDDCLEEFVSQYGGPRYHPFMETDLDESHLVEFGDDGTAYPHGIGGIDVIPNAVTPWDQSPHYVR